MLDWIWFFDLRTNLVGILDGFGFSMFQGLAETSDIGLDLVFPFANKRLGYWTFGFSDMRKSLVFSGSDRVIFIPLSDTKMRCV